MTNSSPNQEKKTFSKFKYLIRHFNFLDVILALAAVLGLACLTFTGIGRMRKPDSVTIGMFAATNGPRRRGTSPHRSREPSSSRFSQFSTEIDNILERMSPAMKERALWNPDELKPSGYEIIRGVPVGDLTEYDLARLRHKHCGFLSDECTDIALRIQVIHEDGTPDSVSQSLMHNATRLRRAARRPLNFHEMSVEQREHATRELITIRTEVAQLVDAWN